MGEFPRQKGLWSRVRRTFQAGEVAYAKTGSIGGCGMFGELQIVPCGCVWGVEGEEAARRIDQSLGLSLPLPLRCLVGACPPGSWPLLRPGDAEKACEVPPEKCRCAVGSILSEGDESPSPELIRLYQKFGFRVFSFPAPSHVVTATFPYTTTLSIWLATRRVHPALDAYIKERKLCAHPRLEIYQEDQIYFMCPLARQGDFYVPEVKETERKSRGPAEADDTQVDGTGADTMSDTSSVSLEVGPGSRETSAATLSPGVSSRGWDDGDTRSEHSYSESGASGSSFEELDLEGEGPMGEPRPSLEAEPLGAAKWLREPSTPEKGEE
ncbi:testis-expressed protein 264 isoform X1 [Vicugna pacos]|uniref:Testis-expressed protein 264 isoform X1 n=3 Tax=Camelidae TaxID=9835 RepID=A0ABM5BM44_VICPA